MNSRRQLASGLLYALVSVVLVVGGLSLALAEGLVNPPPAPAKPSPTLFLPTSAALEATSEATSTLAVIAPSLAPSATVQALVITATRPLASATASARPSPTSTHTYYSTPFSCGPYAGWLHNYVVKQGDTFFHIATLYRTTVGALQIANCKTTTVIFPGEILWVPNVPTVTPGVTIIPTFATATAVPTLPLTLTPLPSPTDTAIPTDTSVPAP